LKCNFIDFVHKFLPKVPKEIIDKENMMMNSFLSLRNESLVKLEQVSDVIKMEEIVSRYHCKKFVDTKKKVGLAF
jgi:hypothetical protein